MTRPPVMGMVRGSTDAAGGLYVMKNVHAPTDAASAVFFSTVATTVPTAFDGGQTKLSRAPLISELTSTEPVLPSRRRVALIALDRSGIPSTLT